MNNKYSNSILSSSVTLLLLRFAVFTCILPVSFSQLHQCKNPPVIFNFGDSNSDTGGIAAGLGYRANLPNGRSYFGKSTGRICDGRLIIDFLCESLNTTLLSPYLNSIDGTFTNGANFAIAGSTTLPRNVPFSLNIQVMQFNYLKERSSELVAAGARNLIGSDGFRDALYMIDIGQNDIARSFAEGLSYAQVVQKIPSILQEVENAIKEIYDQGGRKFWVHNTGPLGCLPQKLAELKNTDSIGCISSYNDAANLFNTDLYQLSVILRSEMKDAIIVYVDLYAIKLDLIANSTQYGFSSPLMACCGSGGPPYNYAKGVTCGGSAGYQVCDEASRFVSWDGVHYTEAANEHIASKIISTKYSTPSMTFDFFCH